MHSPHIGGARSDTLGGFIKANVNVANATLHTDEHRGYYEVGQEFAGGHHSVNHRHGEYARGTVHSNTVESFHGLFERSIQGSWHRISREHMRR